MNRPGPCAHTIDSAQIEPAVVPYSRQRVKQLEGATGGECDMNVAMPFTVTVLT
jgi:hypothetical protein